VNIEINGINNMRYIQPKDYNGNIKPELLKQLTGTTNVQQPSQAQVTAEDTAISTIRSYIGGRYNCDLIFTAWDGIGTDPRNLHMVSCVIKLALYHLYSQTGMQDVPEHRKVQYDDTIQWLKDVGRGTITTELPPLAEADFSPEVRFSSQPPMRHKW
jgi:phage gp36-like protein